MYRCARVMFDASNSQLHDEKEKILGMKIIETEYANTDFDIKSKKSFDTLHRELDGSCCTLHYVHAVNGHWTASYESDHHSDSESNEDSVESGAARDILKLIKAIAALSPTAKAEFDACYLREFNIGFECGDSWAYIHQLPPHVVQAAAKADCSIAVTLYPMRNPDGTPKV